MAWSTPTTASGQILTSAIWNASVRDNLLYLKDREDNPPRCDLYHNTTQSIANTTDTAVAFNSETSDSAALHDPATNNSRITVPSAEIGLWLFTGAVEFDANATGQRKLTLRYGGSNALASLTVDAAAGSNATRLAVSLLVTMAVTNYLELIVSQNSGGSLNLLTTPRFLAVRVA